MIDTLYRLDWSKILPDVQSGLLDGSMRAINGVARRTSDMNQIVQHLPYVPVEMQTSGDLLSRAKEASGLAGVSTVPTAALALSTAVVLGAVIVSTAYLAGKIAEVQLGIAKLEKAMQGHTLIFYIERASHYLGAVGRTREILGNRAVAAENPDLLVFALGQLGQERHSLVSLVESLMGSLDRLPEAHLPPTLEFIHSSLDFIPKAVFLESQAAFRLEKFHFGVEVLENTKTWHESTIANYRDWGQEQLRALVIGKPSEAGRALAMLRNEAKMVIDAEENQLLLKHSV